MKKHTIVKRAIGFLLSILMIACMVPLSLGVYAVTTVLTVGSADYEEGMEVTVPISITANSNLGAATLHLTYDKSKLTFVNDNDDPNYYGGYALQTSSLDVYAPEPGGTVNITIASVSGIKRAGDLLYLEFTVNPGAAGTIPLALTASEFQSYTYPYPNIPYSVVNGAVNVPAVNITFDANGGTGGTGPAAMRPGAALTPPTVTKPGYTFTGWSPSVPGTVPAEDTTYTAQWAVSSCNITFDANGGTGGTGPVAMQPGTTLTPPTVTRFGYTFTGWSPAVPSTVPSVSTTYTAQWSANYYTITFNANGGTGGTSGLMAYGAALTAPAVTKAGYLFAGWTPAVPPTVPAANTTYTARYIKPVVTITKIADGFKVTLKDWDAAFKYQIWSYQKVTSDLFSGGTAKQWVLSKAYTSPSNAAVIHEADGSISFIIASFTSPDKNYTVSVKIADAGNRFLTEVSDSYTPEDVREVKITKVLVDGEFSEGIETKEIDASTPMVFTVVGNNVPGTAYTARVAETGTVLTAANTSQFSWNTSTCTPGTYAITFTAFNGATRDTKTVTVKLYSLDTGIVYGSISGLSLPAVSDTVLPKTVTIDPSFSNGSFYYKVSEPGHTASFISGLFDSPDSIEHTFTKYGIYYIQGYVNRQYEVRIGRNYDDGFFKMFSVSRSLTEPSTEALTADVNIRKPVNKGTPITFTANASIGGIGDTPVQYSFWRYDATGCALVKDWSSDNTLNWTPARVGMYTIEARAKGEDAGSYEVMKSVKLTVTDTLEQIAQGVVISLNTAELNANAKARAPIAIKASATSTNSEDLLYKFNVYDAAMGTSTLQNYSASQECIWTPRKAGTYTISVLVKNTASFGAYDAMQTFDITVS